MEIQGIPIDQGPKFFRLSMGYAIESFLPAQKQKEQFYKDDP